MDKDFIIQQLKKQIEGFRAEVKAEKVGRVIKIGDGVAIVAGLEDVMASEMVEVVSGLEAGEKIIVK